MALDNDQLAALQGADLEPLLDYLKSAGLTMGGIAKLVGEDDSSVFLRNSAMAAFMYGEDLEEDPSELATLALLFVFGARVSRSTYESAIPSNGRALLEHHGLLRREGDLVASQVTIVEYRSFYFLSDKLYENHGGGEILVEPAPDVVWPISEWSMSLAEGLINEPRWQTILDVGCGSGCLGILVHEKYARVVGMDLNPRAVAFSTVNASLNKCANVSFVVGDCFKFDDGTKFDHVIFAAPSGPTFAREGPTVSWGGSLGHELALRFLAEGAGPLMSPGGCCQAWAIFVVQDQHASIRELIEHSLPAGRFQISITPLRHGSLYVPAEDLARNKLPAQCHYAKGDRGPFLELVKEHRVREIVPALVTLRSNA